MDQQSVSPSTGPSGSAASSSASSASQMSPTTTTTGSANNFFQQRLQQTQSKLQTQLQSEQVQKRKQQATKVFQKFGSQIQKINLGKIIDQMEQDQGLADSLEQLNYRMKEEVERQEIRREAEQLGLKVIQDHLDEFLILHPKATYEEWIQDLHPENANQGRLLTDIQEIDARFYVFESDHRRLWNQAMDQKIASHQQDGTTEADPDAVHRRVEARTQIWGKVGGSGGGGGDTGQHEVVDLLSGSVEFQAVPAASPKSDGENNGHDKTAMNTTGFADFSTMDDNSNNGDFVDVDVFGNVPFGKGPATTAAAVAVDPFAPSTVAVDPFAPPSATTGVVTTPLNTINDKEEDLIKF